MTAARQRLDGDTTMVDPITAGLAGIIIGVVTAPVLWTVYSALMNMQEAVDQDVESGDDQ